MYMMCLKKSFAADLVGSVTILKLLKRDAKVERSSKTLFLQILSKVLPSNLFEIYYLKHINYLHKVSNKLNKVKENFVSQIYERELPTV